MNLTDRINEGIDGLTGNPAAHQWIACLEDIRAGVDELTAAAWACTQAKQDRAVDVAELVEAATLHLNKIGCGTALDCEYCDRLRATLARATGEQP